MDSHDCPHDPSTSAANALRSLGYEPGPQPVRQLRQVAAETLADIRLFTTLEPESGGESAEAYTRLLEAAVQGLSVLAENDLDELEQAYLAAEFGLPEPGGES